MRFWCHVCIPVGGWGEKVEKSGCRVSSLHRVISGRGKADNGRGREEEEGKAGLVSLLTA